MKTLRLFFLFFFIQEIFSVSEEGYAKNNDVNIFYVDYGPKDAPAVLLVQGLGGQLTFWPKTKMRSLVISSNQKDVGQFFSLK